MRRRFALAGILLVSLSGCARHGPAAWQGYLEGEFVYVSSPLAGRLDRLSVRRGDRVEAKSPLFTLERAAELAAQRQASAQAQSAESRLEDLRKGSRPTEISAMEARLGEARAAETLSRIDLSREENLLKSGAVAASEYDHARLVHDRDLHAVEELAAQLETARLGGRPDAVAAAEAEEKAARDAVARAGWSVEQKAQAAPCSGLVYDTLYREGEFVPAGSPVVALLPPANLKVRFFVSEKDFASIKAGGAVSVAVPGRPSPLEARVTYLSPQPEYTPPVLYNRDNRSKLVFMVEAEFSGDAARDLHPGQPVDVSPAR
jgi:HlyD family secretion protein